MKNILFIIVFALFTFCCNVRTRSDCDVQGYYWRDYTGDTPIDALQGGSDLDGKPIYIGQIFNLRFLIPAKIHFGDRTAYYEYGGQEHSVTTNIKILCTKHPEHFLWVRTSNAEINLITNAQLVIGGFEPGCTTYIGRIRQGGEILVGKLLADNLPQYAGLYVTSGGKSTRNTTYEVLTFNPYMYKADYPGKADSAKPFLVSVYPETRLPGNKPSPQVVIPATDIPAIDK